MRQAQLGKVVRWAETAVDTAACASCGQHLGLIHDRRLSEYLGGDGRFDLAWQRPQCWRCETGVWTGPALTRTEDAARSMRPRRPRHSRRVPSGTAPIKLAQPDRFALPVRVRCPKCGLVQEIVGEAFGQLQGRGAPWRKHDVALQ